ncbi:TonB-dependent receptor [Brevundimonas sp. 2R-24]|uniref:TonB-dependent receptor n=1 Tax=Peiella sedimenti TaxID=3061083 RepID=A0ABT8SMV1_9CAUL|nr:TonB-dependent receptor [Caulobacteraceae bacterium XZ-24]
MSLAVGASVLALASSTALSNDLPQPTADELAQLSLEQLAQVEVQVTSVSRRPEHLSRAAASIFVISRDDIRRSGATSIPEVLRLAPNLNVQRVNAGDYAISARGFNGFETSNKLLVLIDGRSIYTTLHAGVLWDTQGIVLEDIERIEVISGPGGALYGANAVNGVINIITRSAYETAAPAASVAAGDDDRLLNLRTGGVFEGVDGAWRLSATAFDRSSTDLPSGASANDETAGFRLAGRADFGGASGALTVEGDYFETGVQNDVVINGGFLMARWRSAVGDRGELRLNAYVDHNRRLSSEVDEQVTTWDATAEHVIDLGRHGVVWGGGYRIVESSLVTLVPPVAYLDPPERRITLASLFVQDQIALTPALSLTLGAKVEDSSFTGVEFLPSARLGWTLGDGSLLWGAVSRAARTASRIDRDLTFPGFLAPGNFQSEQLTAYELGWRSQPTPRLSYSVTLFLHDYEDLRTVSPNPSTFLPIEFTNEGEGQSWGVEAWGSYDVTPDWRLTFGANSLEKSFSVRPTGLGDITSLASIGDDPEHQVFFGSHHRWGERLELDFRLRNVGELPRSGIDGYTDADVRIGWRFRDDFELSLIGSNLLHDQRLESEDPERRRLVGRSFLAKLSVGF